MRIVPTGMHDTWVLRFVGHLICFNDRQGIHVCTKGNYFFLRVFSFDQGRPTRSCFGFDLGDADCFQLFCDKGCRLKLLERKLRVAVEVATEIDDLLLVGLSQGFNSVLEHLRGKVACTLSLKIDPG